MKKKKNEDFFPLVRRIKTNCWEYLKVWWSTSIFASFPYYCEWTLCDAAVFSSLLLTASKWINPPFSLLAIFQPICINLVDKILTLFVTFSLLSWLFCFIFVLVVTLVQFCKGEAGSSLININHTFSVAASLFELRRFVHWHTLNIALVTMSNVRILKSRTRQILTKKCETRRITETHPPDRLF